MRTILRFVGGVNLTIPEIHIERVLFQSAGLGIALSEFPWLLCRGYQILDPYPPKIGQHIYYPAAMIRPVSCFLSCNKPPFGILDLREFGILVYHMFYVVPLEATNVFRKQVTLLRE